MIESDMVKKCHAKSYVILNRLFHYKRLGASAEVANTIVFFKLEASSYIVGQTLIVDGGMVMR